MSVRDSSRLAYEAGADSHARLRARILNLLVSKGEMTRRQVADQLRLETSCVAGRVNELIKCGVVLEDVELRQCPITQIRVHWIHAAPAPDQVAA